MDAEEVNSSDSDATVYYGAENDNVPALAETGTNTTPPTNVLVDDANQISGQAVAQMPYEEPTHARTPEPNFVEIAMQASQAILIGSQNTQDDVIKPRSTKKRKR